MIILPAKKRIMLKYFSNQVMTAKLPVLAQGLYFLEKANILMGKSQSQKKTVLLLHKAY
jgi:hypothetical protein